MTNQATGKLELEALHQIPMKWIEDVTYINMYGDHRFSIKIFNVLEEFQFRTRDADSAHNWVVTLLSAVEASNKGIMMSNVTPPPLAGSENSKTGNVDNTTSSLSSDGPVTRGEEPKVHTIKELRAIAEKNGIGKLKYRSCFFPLFINSLFPILFLCASSRFSSKILVGWKDQS